MRTSIPQLPSKRKTPLRNQPIGIAAYLPISAIYSLQPLSVDDEDLTVDILRHLISQGYEGDELLKEYQATKRKIVSVKEKIREAEDEVENGRTAPAADTVAKLRAKYGLYR